MMSFLARKKKACYGKSEMFLVSLAAVKVVRIRYNRLVY